MSCELRTTVKINWIVISLGSRINIFQITFSSLSFFVFIHEISHIYISISINIYIYIFFFLDFLLQCLFYIFCVIYTVDQSTVWPFRFNFGPVTDSPKKTIESFFFFLKDSEIYLHFSYWIQRTPDSSKFQNQPKKETSSIFFYRGLFFSSNLFQFLVWYVKG